MEEIRELYKKDEVLGLEKLLEKVKELGIYYSLICDGCYNVVEEDPCPHCDIEELWGLGDMIEDEIDQIGAHCIDNVIDGVERYIECNCA